MTYQDYYAECTSLLRDYGVSEEIVSRSVVVDEYINDGFMTHSDPSEVAQDIIKALRQVNHVIS